MNAKELGTKINDAGREFKAWVSEFMLVYSPLFVLLGFLMTGTDVLLNGKMATSLWFMVPWAIVQTCAVDGLWFAVWVRILTDRYTWRLWIYHLFIVVIGLCMSAIAVIMADVVFFQQSMDIPSSIAALQFIGIPVGIFLHSRAVLLVATATLALVFDKVMREKMQAMDIPAKKSTPAVRKPMPRIPAKDIPSIPASLSPTIVTPVPQPTPGIRLLPPVDASKGYEQAIRAYMQTHQAYTYQDICTATGAKLPTVKKWVPKIKSETQAS